MHVAPRPHLLILALAAFVLCLFAASASGQSADTAGLEVDVHDPSGAVVQGASLVLINQSTHLTREGTTGKDGVYRFAEVPVGDYTLSVKKDGFAEIVESGISLSVAESGTLPVTMKVSGSQQQIDVSAELPMVDVNRTTSGQTISAMEIENLPSNGRNFTDFALTVPGVTPQATSGQGSGLSINGQRGRSNNIMIDGVENNGQINGTVRQTLSQDAISQFQVMTNQFLPEYGNAGGGLVNVVTKSGTSNFHGDLFYFFRDQALNAHPYCFVANCPAPVFVQNDVGATLGGPIDKEKTVFFAAVEYLGLNTNLVDNITPATVSGVNAILALRPLVNGGVKSIGASNSVPLSTTQTLASLRIDHTFNDKNTLSLHMLYGHYNHNNPTLDRSDGGYSDPSNYGYDTLHAYNYTANYTHVFNLDLLNQFYFQFSPQHLIQVPNDPVGPSVYISNAVQFGRNTDFPTLLNENHYEWIDSLSLAHGHHLFKIGMDADLVRANTSFPTDFAGLFSFTCVYSATPAAGFPAAPAGTSTCIDNLEDGKPYQYVQGFGQPQIALPDWILSWYAEDSWKLRPRLTLNYGIRYDLDLQPQGYNGNLSDPIEAPLPKGIPRDYNNVGPRLGVAWGVDRKSKTVVRAGYGIFYDKIFLLVARNTLLARNTLSENTVAAATAQLLTGPYPQSANYPAGVSVVAPSINAITHILPIPYAQQANLYVDQTINENWSAEVGYIYVSGGKELKSANINLGPPVILTASNANAVCGCTPTFQQIGRAYYPTTDLLNPSFTAIQEVGSWGHSRYNAMQASIIHRATSNLSLRASWIWSKEIDDASDFTQAQQPDNSYYPHGERSIGDEDQRNRFTAAGVYTFPYSAHSGKHSTPLRLIFGDWVGSTIATVYSGSPYDLTVGSDVNNDGNAAPDRPFINGSIVKRNDFRGPRQQNVSLRLQKRIRIHDSTRLEFSVESFNSFNHANFNGADTLWGTGTGPGNVIWGTASKAQSTSSFGSFTSTNVTSTTTPGQREIQLGGKFFF